MPAPRCVLFEDDDLLVVNKPAGWNTHAPAPYGGEGIYDWLRHREPRWASLALMHRLDKETSGVLVFAKTPAANRSLTAQFTDRHVRKEYVLLTDRPVPAGALRCESVLGRIGARYASRPKGTGGECAVTEFEACGGESGLHRVLARPLTGRTHQIRVHAAERGFPVLGDGLYGGTPGERVCLHAARIEFLHPATGQAVSFHAPVDFTADRRLALRDALGEAGVLDDTWRLVHGVADGWPGFYVERLGDRLLAQSDTAPGATHLERLERWRTQLGLGAVAFKPLRRQVRGAAPDDASPQTMLGAAPSPTFVVRENGLRYELSFGAGYSVGLFLDQRDNRRRLLANHVAAGFPAFGRAPATASCLNLFAYTCGFSVAAGRAGAQTTSVDVSRKYLEWGRRNFALNGLDAAGHTFLAGDAFEWLRRLGRQGRCFDVVVLDPPTFSTSKARGRFQVERDLGELVQAATPVTARGGRMLVSTNAADYRPETFVADVRTAIRGAGRTVRQEHYAPQPPDFPVHRDEPAYLKTLWIGLD